MYSIYLITNRVNGKIYIGYTRGTPEWRFGLHAGSSNSDVARNRALSRAIRKYGRGSFVVSTIETVATLAEAKVREIYHIKDRNSTSNKVGYNMTHGGDGPPSEEVIKRRSEAIRGRKMSEESRAKMRLAKAKEKHPLWGKHLPPEWAAKISAAQVGKRKGPKNQRWHVLPVDEIVSMYQSGMTTRAIAEKMNCDHTTIMVHLVAEGIKLRTKVESWAMWRQRTQLLNGAPE